MNLMQHDFDLLKGLRNSGNTYVSASEAEAAERLADAGLVKLWSTVGGFHAWCLTEDGSRALKAIENLPSPPEST